MAVQTQILHRRDTAANWTAANPVLGGGELGFETDTTKFKIGNGSTAWASLNYYVSSASPTFTGTVTLPTGTVTSDMIADLTIVNADVNASAAIAHSKLANATAGQVLLGTTTTGVVTATTISGDITVTGGGVAAISSAVIVDADVNASAAIAHSKLANASPAQVLLGTTTSGAITATTVSGDITIGSTGVTAIGSGVIVNADVNTGAAIAHSKLANATAGQILLGTTTTGVVTATTISGDVTVTGAGVTAIASGVIVDADVNASAAIALSKLATGALPTAITVASANVVNGSLLTTDFDTTTAVASGGVPVVTVSTVAPTGGKNGDVWIVV